MTASVQLFCNGQWVSAEIIVKKGIILRTTEAGFMAVVKSPSQLFVRSFEDAIASRAPHKLRVESDLSEPSDLAVRCISIATGPEMRLEFASV